MIFLLGKQEVIDNDDMFQEDGTMLQQTFFWGCLKDSVYVNKPPNIEELEKIRLWHN